MSDTLLELEAIMLYTLCGCSGAGKSTLLEATLQSASWLTRLTTYTTRAPRLGEVHGRDYHFITLDTFQQYVRAEHIVCPIQYRGKWYGTHLLDLEACRQKTTLAVLRPDKIAELAVYTPIIGVYIEMLHQEYPTHMEDLVIYEHQLVCQYHITNVPGSLDQAVTQLLALIEMEVGGKHASRDYHPCR